MAERWLAEVASGETFPVLVDRSYGGFTLSPAFRDACRRQGLCPEKLATNRHDPELLAIVMQLGVSKCEGFSSTFVIEQVPKGATYKFILKDGCETLVHTFDASTHIGKVLEDDSLRDADKVQLLRRLMAFHSF